MSIISHKPQTTRHRIIGLVSDDDYQVVFSDTPGLVNDPAYKMHKAMNSFVMSTFEDADIFLFMTDMTEKYQGDEDILAKLKKTNTPKFLVLNKTDLATEEEVLARLKWWSEQVEFDELFPISALNKLNTEELFQAILKKLPEGPVYYPKDQFTDRPERFFVSEIIREKIFLNYRDEIPYSVDVDVDHFKHDPVKPLIRIHANIYVLRKSQKIILIGKGGSAIKRVGIDARKSLEKFLDSHVYLELQVRVKDNWRDDDRTLKHFGY